MCWTFGRTWRRPCPACGAPRCRTGEAPAPHVPLPTTSTFPWGSRVGEGSGCTPWPGGGTYMYTWALGAAFVSLTRVRGQQCAPGVPVGSLLCSGCAQALPSSSSPVPSLGSAGWLRRVSARPGSQELCVLHWVFVATSWPRWVLGFVLEGARTCWTFQGLPGPPHLPLAVTELPCAPHPQPALSGLQNRLYSALYHPAACQDLHHPHPTFQISELEGAERSGTGISVGAVAIFPELAISWNYPLQLCNLFARCRSPFAAWRCSRRVRAALHLLCIHLCQISSAASSARCSAQRLLSKSSVSPCLREIGQGY